ncbi:reverse transcriptase family protein [Flavisphingomonas formosensis]|uniref:reverse transcriptase family protein n=1 Tax=Flavisphingomonas formosensis TaxID=861534 RepID=UPI001E539706|nr:reverse transcriptase family protein [Sphingomonas formosensis]
MSSPAKLAHILGLTDDGLTALIGKADVYHEFDIAKKGGGKRHVENPTAPLKAVQAKLAKFLAAIDPPDFLFCPVKGRCYVTNAASHRASRVVHCLDIKKFFPSTPSRRVFWFFETVMKCRKDVASIITRLSTYQGRLPTGSPLSPIMAYFAYCDLWAKLDAFCRERGYKLTVYIDDVTVSGQKVPLSDIWRMKQMIHGYGLRYHKEKTFVDRPAEITGVIVRGDKLAVPHRQHLKRRSAQRELLLGEGDTQVLQGRLAGLDGQIRQVACHNGKLG